MTNSLPEEKESKTSSVRWCDLWSSPSDGAGGRVPAPLPCLPAYSPCPVGQGRGRRRGCIHPTSDRHYENGILGPGCGPKVRSARVLSTQHRLASIHTEEAESDLVSGSHREPQSKQLPALALSSCQAKRWPSDHDEFFTPPRKG